MPAPRRTGLDWTGLDCHLRPPSTPSTGPPSRSPSTPAPQHRTAASVPNPRPSPLEAPWKPRESQFTHAGHVPSQTEARPATGRPAAFGHGHGQSAAYLVFAPFFPMRASRILSGPVRRGVRRTALRTGARNGVRHLLDGRMKVRSATDLTRDQEMEGSHRNGRKRRAGSRRLPHRSVASILLPAHQVAAVAETAPKPEEPAPFRLLPAGRLSALGSARTGLGPVVLPSPSSAHLSGGPSAFCHHSRASSGRSLNMLGSISGHAGLQLGDPESGGDSGPGPGPGPGHQGSGRRRCRRPLVSPFTALARPPIGKSPEGKWSIMLAVHAEARSRRGTDRGGPASLS
ncbi:hypothetical protein B2J93_5558 [Marssonina coronariae]|uniref:Uncharacterized protein n=1 Tax=Diplocarpon coronariae TaxID=2795749 RepID=A0A218Z023_9HELO|nr:hypothetical protein B2J93_5558 [Marssonina coronariae]